MIKKLVVASTLIIPILLVAVVYGWESIFAGSVIWFLIWFVILGRTRYNHHLVFQFRYMHD